jgi:phosphoenolpyruvate-protein phosphotransferase
MKKGVPVSPGVAVARAYCVTDRLTHREPQHLDGPALSGEVNRFLRACAAAGKDLDAMIARVSKEVGEDEANIFRAHRSLVSDPALLGKVKSIILTRQVDARTALEEALNEYTALFNQIQDEYLRGRMSDVRDVAGRILSHLSEPDYPHGLEATEPLIIVASEILPSQVMMFKRMRIAGIITETGGTTGHAAILARSQGIPAVSGLHGILTEVQTGDVIAVDGREGHVYLRPGPEVEAAYRKLQREYVDLRDRLIVNRDQEPISADGVRVELLANVNGLADAALAVQVGASGVGLYRTEYLFLTHAEGPPDEEEQLNAYREVIDASPNRTVTIRTLDLGGDKQVPYLGNPHETNPFMGWRSIRLSSAHPKFFQTQLRAILRAGLFGKVSLLFPMISTLEEVRQLKRMVDRTKAALQRDGLPFADAMPLGIMLEVPSAALCIRALLDEVDFVSIGSNDLTQYVMAADRDNPKVAHLCDPFSPAIMKMLRHVIKACDERQKPVTLCGEMAALPRCFPPLFGMGLRSLSMSPAFVPPLKELIRNTTHADARRIAHRVLRLKTVKGIRGYLTRKVRDICPNVAILDIWK